MLTRPLLVAAAFVLATQVEHVSDAARAPDGASIVRGEGAIKLEGAGEWRAATPADVLTAGTSVRAAADQPLEMRLPDGVTVTLEPDAVARWMPGGKLPSETNTWAHGYHLLLEEGDLEVLMPKAPKGSHAFLVSCLAGTLTDWRGHMHVSVHGKSTAAAIYEGALVVGSNGHGFPVYDGAGIVMRRGVNPDKSRGIPPAPAWQGGSGGLTVAPAGSTAPVPVAWTPVPQASAYRVEVASDPSMDHVTLRATTAEPRFAVASAAGGTWVRVRAVGADGIIGTWSTPHALRALRYALPEGAFVASDGVVVLPSRSHLSVVDEAGSAPPIEVAYENVGEGVPGVDVPLYWSPLGSMLMLADDAPGRIVHLRDPASGAAARLVLARRELRADVTLSPANARWPADPIDARVDVRDPTGRVDVTREPVTVEALLDLTPLDVQWERRGSTWLARIAPRFIGDPSVVRVVVKDERGTEIGRAFVELAPVASK